MGRGGGRPRIAYDPQGRRMDHLILTFVILGLAIALFLSEKLRPDLVALLVLVALGTTGVLTSDETFSGFSRSAVITILAIFILAAGLERTGVARQVGNLLIRVAGREEGRLVVAVMLAGAFLSLFMNNIAAASVLLPAVSGAARRSGVSPARLLLPLAFGTILGGMATLFTTTNIVVSSLLRDRGLPGYNFRERELEAARLATSEAALAPRPPLTGQPLRDPHFRDHSGMNVIATWRAGKPLRRGLSDLPLELGDGLLLQGDRARLSQLRTDPDLIVLGAVEEVPVVTGKSRLALAIMVITLGRAAWGKLPVAGVMLGGALAMPVSSVLRMDQ